MLFRRLVLGAFVLALGLSVSVSAAVAADAAVAKIAHIRLKGDLDETPVAVDPLFSSGGENFRSKLERFRKAKDDKDITAVYLQLESLSIGWGKLDELRGVVKECRAAGKKVYAFLEDAESKEYLLGLGCDEVCMPESGTLMLTGMRAEVSFYKKLLENLSLKADVLQMGDFKGTTEPFVRTEMSPEVRKQLETVLDDFYEKSYVGTIVSSRPGKKWSPAAVKKMIDEGPYTAKKALELGLIDRVAYSEGFQDKIKEELKAEKVVMVKNYGQSKGEDLDFSNPFALMMKLMKPPTSSTSNKSKIAVIYATGPIASGKGGDGGVLGGHTVGSVTMIEAIRQAEQDKTVKAIVLRVDSPGGSALASDLIWNELLRCKKPIVASMSDVAASGGYYISMAAKKIYAEPGTITGSIGVFGMKLVIGDLEKRVGLGTEVISRGTNSGIESSQTLYSDSERKAMRTIIEDVYDQFLTKAIAGRKKAGKEMTREQLLKLAGGRIWTGRQAKENGLVDELGTLDDAIASAKEMSGNKGAEMEILQLPKARSFIDSFLENRLDERAPGLSLAQVEMLRAMPGMDRHIKTLDMLLKLKGEKAWVLMPYRFEVR